MVVRRIVLDAVLQLPIETNETATGSATHTYEYTRDDVWTPSVFMRLSKVTDFVARYCHTAAVARQTLRLDTALARKLKKDIRSICKQRDRGKDSEKERTEGAEII